MVYSKLPPQPPPYSQQDARQPGPPSAPPAAMASAPTNEMPLNSIGPPAPYSNPTTVVQNNIVVTGGQGMICPKCNANIRLRVEHHATCSTYCMAAILCLFLCWPCVCLPCCCNCCYKTSQFCPNCNACLGSF